MVVETSHLHQEIKRQMGDQKCGQNHDGVEAKKKLRTKRKAKKIGKVRKINSAQFLTWTVI